jgi:Zn-dependent protease with chaperone function
VTTNSPRSLFGRALAAVTLTVGFYALGLTLAVAMIAFPIAAWVTNGPFNIWATVALLAAGWTILRALVPARDRFDLPGPELTRAAQPELYRELDAVADSVGEPLPPHVYLDAAVNASVAEISNGLLRGRRRIMILGLPLLATLRPDGLRAVVAHEFGHYVAGDTRFSAWIWRTRVAVLKTVQALDNQRSWFQRVIVRAPFLWYAKLFLRLTNAISRRAEFAADALAARVAGATAQADALRSVAGAGPAYSSYWNGDVAYALNRGHRPPIAAGFQHFLADHKIRVQLDEVVAAEIADAETNPYDSHPTLGDRLRAIGAPVTAELAALDPQDSAVMLLRDVPALEHELLVAQFGSEAVAGLETVGWEQTGALYADEGDSIIARYGRAFERLTVGDVEEAAAPIDRLRSALGEETGDMDDEQLAAYWRFALGRLVLAALRREGWTVQTEPGRPLQCVRDGEVFEPYEELLAATEEANGSQRWRESCRRLGIADVALVPGI